MIFKSAVAKHDTQNAGKCLGESLRLMTRNLIRLFSPVRCWNLPLSVRVISTRITGTKQKLSSESAPWFTFKLFLSLINYCSLSPSNLLTFPSSSLSNQPPSPGTRTSIIAFSLLILIARNSPLFAPLNRWRILFHLFSKSLALWCENGPCILKKFESAGCLYRRVGDVGYQLWGSSSYGRALA